MTNEQTLTMTAQTQEHSQVEARAHPNEVVRDHRDCREHSNELGASSNINSSASSGTFKYRLFDSIVIVSFISFIACTACMAYLHRDSILVPSPKPSSGDQANQADHADQANQANRAVPSLRNLNSIADEKDFLNSFISTGDDSENDANDANNEYDANDANDEDTKTLGNNDIRNSAPFKLGEIVQVRLTTESEYYFPAHVRRATIDHSGQYHYDLTSAIHGFRTMNGVDATRVYSMQVAPGVAQMAQLVPRGTEAMCQFKMQVPCRIIEYHGEECISAGGCYEVLSRWDDEALIAAERENNNNNGNSNLRGAKVEIQRRIPLDHVQFRVEDLNLISASIPNNISQSNEALQLEDEATAVMARREEATEEVPNMR